VYNIGKQASKEHMSSNELVKVWNDFYSTLWTFVDSPGCNINSAELQTLIMKLMTPGSLGFVLFVFQLWLFVAKPGHTRASAERWTLICEAAYGRELGLFYLYFPSLFLC
jgi:hypothetical protein